MKLVVVTPLGLVVESAGVEHVLAEDSSGLFGVRRGHAEFVTVLTPSVLSWTDREGQEFHAAVRSGVLYVRAVDGEVQVEVATREALVSDDLGELEQLVESSFRAEVAAEEVSRGQAARMHGAVYRGVMRYLRPEESAPGDPPVRPTGKRPLR